MPCSSVVQLTCKSTVAPITPPIQETWVGTLWLRRLPGATPKGAVPCASPHALVAPTHSGLDASGYFPLRCLSRLARRYPSVYAPRWPYSGCAASLCHLSQHSPGAEGGGLAHSAWPRRRRVPLHGRRETEEVRVAVVGGPAVRHVTEDPRVARPLGPLDRVGGARVAARAGTRHVMPTPVDHGVAQRQRGAAHQAHRLRAGRRHERVQRRLPGAGGGVSRVSRFAGETLRTPRRAVRVRHVRQPEPADHAFHHARDAPVVPLLCVRGGQKKEETGTRSRRQKKKKQKPSRESRRANDARRGVWKSDGT